MVIDAPDMVKMISSNKLLMLLSIVCLNIFFLFTNLFNAEFNVDKQPKNPFSIKDHIPPPQPSRSSKSKWPSTIKKKIINYEELLKLKPLSSDAEQSDTVNDLVKRLLPQHHQWFSLKVDSNYVDDGNFFDRFKIENILDDNGHKIKITANTGVALANGVHYYLKYVTNSSVSWSGDQINLSSVSGGLPKINQTIEMIIKEKFRYYQNACTTSYSMVWWQWPRWERELDWMALNGINLPLAFNGQEMVFRNTFKRFNLTTEEIDEYFTGPAYLAWNRMGNIQYWSGPLTEHWHQHQYELQKRILDRMRAFGMYPIAPGFSGHVPRAFKRKHPWAKINHLDNWNHFGANFSRTDFLEPEDPNFIKIGKVFIEEYIKLYGTGHFYNIDMFVEETPSSRNLLYLHNIGKNVYESIRQADPTGVWVLQGYPFNSLYDKFWGPDQVKALITGVPKNRMIILDVIAEVMPIYPQVDGYYGRPFIWCILHNYGGVHGMFGSLNRINRPGVFDARHNYPNMLGIGIAPEGILQNDIVYDYMLEVPWHDRAPNMSEWFSRYAQRRYGVQDRRIDQAWQKLRQSVYHDPIGIKNHGRYIFVSRPRPNSHSMLWYDPHDLTRALRLLVEYLKENPEIKEKSPLFVHDLVDVARQSLQLIFDYHYKILDQAFSEKRLETMIHTADKLNDILELTESTLQSCANCLLYNWINDARTLAKDQNEQDYNEWQARTQISVWGPKLNIANYAAKQWSAMFQHLYQPRWRLYFSEIIDCVQTNRSYNETEFRWQLFQKIDLPFTRAKGQKLIQKANTSKLISNVNQVVDRISESIDLQPHFKYYYNDTERWLE